jgi:hypothetical protein
VALHAYHNSDDLKSKAIQRIVNLKEEGKLIIGREHGGASANLLGDLPVQSLPLEMGFPESFAYALDRVYGLVPESQAAGFLLLTLEAIPVGADLQSHWFKFANWMFNDPSHGLCSLTNNIVVLDVGALFLRAITDPSIDPQYWREAIEGVVEVDNRYVPSEIISRKEWSSAEVKVLKKQPSLIEIPCQNALRCAVKAAETQYASVQHIPMAISLYARAQAWHKNNIPNWNERWDAIGNSIGSAFLRALNEEKSGGTA